MTNPPSTVRVHHPTLPTGKNVPASEVEAWVAQGWLSEQPARGRAPAEAPNKTSSGNAPRGNASREAWLRYAVANGASEEDLKDRSRNEIRDTYAPADN